MKSAFNFVLVAAVLIPVANLHALEKSATARKPNVVIILADDKYESSMAEARNAGEIAIVCDDCRNSELQRVAGNSGQLSAINYTLLQNGPGLGRRYPIDLATT